MLKIRRVNSNSGVISVFLIIILIVFIVLIGSIINVLRVKYLKNQIKRYIDLAAFSAKVEYNRDLKNNYGLLVTNKDIFEDTFKEYFKVNIENMNNKNRFKYDNVDLYKIKVIEDESIADSDNLKFQILNQMKYKAPIKLYEFINILKKVSSIKEDIHMLDIIKKYHEEIQNESEIIAEIDNDMQICNKYVDVLKEDFHNRDLLANLYKKSKNIYNNNVKYKKSLLNIRKVSIKYKKELEKNTKQSTVKESLIKDLSDLIKKYNSNNIFININKSNDNYKVIKNLYSCVDLEKYDYYNIFNNSKSINNKTNIYNAKCDLDIKSVFNKVIDKKLYDEFESNEQVCKDNDKLDIKNIVLDNIDKVLSNIYINEYICEMFTNAINYSKYDEVKSRFLKAEVEYIIGGDKKEIKNVEYINKKIFNTRLIMNLIYLYSSNKRKDEAKKIAASYSILLDKKIIVPILKHIILFKWSILESNKDIKLLHSNVKIPLIKNDVTWITNNDKNINNKDKFINDKTIVAGYGEYLRLYLFLMNENTKLNRIKNLICLNMNINNKSYSIKKDIVSYYVEVYANIDKIFLNREITSSNETKNKNYSVTINKKISYE